MIKYLSNPNTNRQAGYQMLSQIASSRLPLTYCKEMREPLTCLRAQDKGNGFKWGVIPMLAIAAHWAQCGKIETSKSQTSDNRSYYGIIKATVS